MTEQWSDKVLYRSIFFTTIPDLLTFKFDIFPQRSELSELRIQNLVHIPHWDCKEKLKKKPAMIDPRKIT